jgi:hypothetical protein
MLIAPGPMTVQLRQVDAAVAATLLKYGAFVPLPAWSLRVINEQNGLAAFCSVGLLEPSALKHCR